MSSSRMERKLPIAKHFFKVMMPGFLTELYIPPAFCGQLGEVKSEEAILTSRKGSWHIKIGKRDKGFIYFREGWDNFVQHHGLCLGDFAVFEHIGDMHFNVYVFDSSACEKEFPLKLAREIKREPQVAHEIKREPYVAYEIKKESRVAYEIKKEPRGVNIHENVKHIKREWSLKAAASYSPERPHFVTTIKASNGKPASPYLNIPAEFLKSNNLGQTSSITLRDPSGKLWSAELKSRNTNSLSCNIRTFIANGWYEFYDSNKLKKGDVCLFELNHSTRRSKTVVMDVHIFPQPNLSNNPI
ncbi:hypothetical protein F0562_035935 [Nyssa sinensis]|uniref:TF-B3 domain-containing protein n=1 Tax=Nyssa sinensis TaxID=561372 RepID=A0A5J5AD68_9ASTE|nr:hypothetical protein F0562_035935 [Nyssa sinensis]